MRRVVSQRVLVVLLAVVAWNASFDLQLRRAGDRFVADQLERLSKGQPVQLIADGFQPLVRGAAVVSTLGTGLLVIGAWLVARPPFARATAGRPRHRST